MRSAFGVEHPDQVSKKSGAMKLVNQANKTLRFENMGDMKRAFKVGQKKGWRNNYGPLRSGLEGVGYAINRSPGGAALIGGGGAAGLAGGGFAAGRMTRKDRNADKG